MKGATDMQEAAQALGIDPKLAVQRVGTPPATKTRNAPTLIRHYKPDADAQEQAIKTLIASKRDRAANDPGTRMRGEDGIRASSRIPQSE